MMEPNAAFTCSRFQAGVSRKPIMTKLKSALVKSAVIASMAASVVVATATAASADVACNRFGECWRVQSRYTNYPPALRVTFHDDGWRATHSTSRWQWRDDRPDDHGYYDHNTWHPF
jgi:hypothetical protein